MEIKCLLEIVTTVEILLEIRLAKFRNSDGYLDGMKKYTIRPSIVPSYSVFQFYVFETLPLVKYQVPISSLKSDIPVTKTKRNF